MSRLMRRLQSVPGVLGVTVSENGIFSGTDSETDGLRIEGYSSTRKQDLSSHFDQVGPHYFQVVGAPVVAGRDFNERDVAGAPNVAILNDVMARFYFGSRDPIGKLLANGSDRYTIVGVVKDIRERNLKGQAERRFFVSLLQSTDRFESFNFELRTRDDAAHMLPAIRHAVLEGYRTSQFENAEPRARRRIDRPQHQ